MFKRKMDYDFIGNSTPGINAYEKVTGKTCYVSDIRMPGMLIGKALRSPYAHAKILSIDTTKAKKVPGVKCILTGKEVNQNKWGALIKDTYILAIDKVRYIGDEVVAVAAVDEDACDEAISQIKMEYEQLPAVFDTFEAMKENAPIIHEEFPNNINRHSEIVRGDVDKIFFQADYVFENEYRTSRAYHACLEPMGSISDWDKHGNLIIYAGTQNPTVSRRTYAHALDISSDKITVVQPFYGGGFGLKVEQQAHLVGALLAKYAKQPVRFVLNRGEDIENCRPRVPMYFKLRTAWSKEGEFLAKDVYIVCDNGAYTYKARAIAMVAMYRIDVLYKVRNLRSILDLVYTNNLPTSGFRGYGNAQMHFALESHIDEVAERINIEPSQLRLKNIVYPGYINPHGMEVTSCAVDKCIKTLVQKSSFLEKKKINYSKIKDNSQLLKKGIGLSIAMHASGASFTSKEFVDGAAALLRINEDGNLFIYSNEPDMGQGINEVKALSAAEILKIPLNKIRIPTIDTSIAPYGLGVFASRGTYLVNSAIKNAAINLRTKILLIASKIVNKPVRELAMSNDSVVWIKNEKVKVSIKEISWKYICDNAGQNLLAQGSFRPKNIVFPDEDFYGNYSGAYAYGGTVAEVEVDTRTGKVDLLNIWAAFDVGQPINPIALEGQIIGGAIQGFGWALMENLVINEEGKLLNPSLLDYQIPTIKDIPAINTYIVDSFEESSGFGGKSIGELSIIPIVSAIANAIYNAVGIRLYELPFSPEIILDQIQNNKKRSL